MKLWLKAALIRAIKTMAETAIAYVSMATVLQEVDWQLCASASALAGILSLLLAIKGLPEVPSGSGDPEDIEDLEDGEDE